LQEQKKQSIVAVAELSVRKVILFIDPWVIECSGNWSWELNSDSVFCSDVWLDPPLDFQGTHGMIHPEDLPAILELFPDHSAIENLHFRIITSYGEIKILDGHGLHFHALNKTPLDPKEGWLDQAHKRHQHEKEFDRLLLARDLLEQTEKDTATGTWYYNSFTNETWYSNECFRIHQLSPQSLNAHLNTFLDFIHPDDREISTVFIDQAFKKRLPLRMEYRILVCGSEKTVLYQLHWNFNYKGEHIALGTIRDITHDRNMEQAMEESAQLSTHLRSQMQFDEQAINTGHFQINLLTRKTIFSDNLYRIFGVRPQSIPGGINAFINYIHPEDREAFQIANKKMLHEHHPPDLEYRMIRSDGKLRYLSQKAKLFFIGDEMIMGGTVQDVTVRKSLENRIEELTRAEEISKQIFQQAEEMAKMGSWVTDVRAGKTNWSDSFYTLLGLKPQSVEFSYKRFLMFVHADDQKKFSDELVTVQNRKEATVFNFRLLVRGEVLHMRAQLSCVLIDESEILVGLIRNTSLEEQLQQSMNQRIQLAEALAKNITDRVMITDISNNIILWNKQCESVYRIKQEEAIGKNFFDVFPQLKTEDMIQLFKTVNLGETICRKELKSPVDQGYYDLHMVPMWNEEKMEVVGVIHILHDITQEHQLRQRLNERLNFIERLVDSSIDRIIALDRQMNYIYWNRTAEEYYGLKKENVVGRNLLEIFPAFINEPSYQHFRNVLHGETVHIAPEMDQPGEETSFETFLIPIKDEQGEVAGILWMVHDFSKEVRLEYEQARANQILNTIQEVYFELDRDNNFIYVNRMAEVIWDTTKEVLIGKNIWTVFPEIRQSGGYYIIMEAQEKKKKVQGEYVSPIINRRVFMSALPSRDGLVVLYYELGKGEGG
jgi:PAS domain S-box-containing protein